MKINIIAPSTTSLTMENNLANVQGDELVARLWIKNLLCDPRVTCAHLNGNDTYDVSISFSPLLECTGGLKVLYLQNIFPKPRWPGTVEMYAAVKHQYDAFIFPSDGLRERCGSGLVCQFATDPDLFFPQPPESRFEHNACFVGNNIRDPETTQRYLLCAAESGLVIYGNPASWEHPNCAGKISLENERLLYSSAKICLNAHVTEHLEYGAFNFRLFNIMACAGFIISDRAPYLEREFSDCMVFTDGDQHLLRMIEYFCANQDETYAFRRKGREKVLARHTFHHRMQTLLAWLETKL